MGYITMQGILQLLRVDKGPSGSGEYLARCPAHDDRQASLSLREGEKGILLKCHAGCSVDDICRRLGIEVRDLFCEAGAAGGRRSAARRPAQAPPEGGREGVGSRQTGDLDGRESEGALKVCDVKTYDSYEAAFGHLGRIVKAYPYTDAGGRLLFTVVRILPPDGKKTFRQCRPANGSAGGWPIVTGVPVGVRGNVIYRLPEVAEAIRDGRTVYVVEGEKDADTLAAMGYVGTTSPMGADHWTKAHGENLKGADVVVLPDNDAPGESYEAAVVGSVAGIARQVRSVHLAEGIPELPPHGDISDLADMVGLARAKEMLDALVAQAAPLEAHRYRQAVNVFDGIKGFCVEDGCLCKWSDKGNRVLSTFIALPVWEVTRDDGATVTKFLEIDGWNASGRRLKRLSVPIAKYKSMDWVMEGWGLTANIMPGNTVRDQLRSVIAEAGAQVAEQRTIYTHTGWRRIDGKWCFLYEGGCIGADRVSVDMGPGLDSYTLDAVPEKLGPMDAALSCFEISGVISERVSVPLLGVTFLAPLREFLLQAGTPPAFITFLKGASGTLKTTAAALFLSFFGNFHNKAMPANFGDTANNIRYKAFCVKDMLLVIDDYHPQTNMQERRRMETTAQSLARAFGDMASRGRMGADLTILPSKPPRCIAMMTGEQLPDVGTSGVSRYYVVDVEKDDIPRSGAMSELQRRARDGEFRAAMRGYIEWLAPQADQLPQRLERMFYDFRDRANALMRRKGTHGRTNEAIAQIMIGLTVMMHYFESTGAIDHDGAAAIIERYWEIIARNSAAQSDASAEDSPASMFVRALSEMLMSKELAVMDLSPGSEMRTPAKGMVGYADGRCYYLMPETAFGAVVRFYKDQDRIFPLSLQATYKQLREEGILEIGRDGKATKSKRTPDGKVRRLLWIPRFRLDGGSAPQEQTKMDFDADGNDGYCEIQMEDVPKELQ